MHADQPTQDEAMTAFPDTGHPTKQDDDKKGQVGDRDHSTPYRAQGGGDQIAGMLEILF